MSDMVVLGMSISGVVIGVLLILWECRFKRWTKTEGIITAVETTRLPIIMHAVDAFTADRIGLLDERYNVYLSYEYQVEGQRYSGKGLPNRQDRKLSPAELKQKLGKDFVTGERITVFLNPRRPQTSVLDNSFVGWGLVIVVWSLMPLVGMLLGFLVYKVW